MTLSQIIDVHDLRTESGVPGQDRWVAVVTETCVNQMLGALHKATDYTVCNCVNSYSKDGLIIVWLQRNGKPSPLPAMESRGTP